jgi:hypothetical protein
MPLFVARAPSPFHWLRACMNWCRRAALPLLKYLSRLVYPTYGSHCVFCIGKRTLVKTGKRVRLVEADTLRFIAENTSIPVPKVFDSWTLLDGGAAILMEWIEDATPLELHWPTMTEKQKLKVAHQLRAYVDALPQPPNEIGCIGPLNGAPCWDERLKSRLCGPFLSERAFNEFRLGLLDRFLWEDGACKDIQAIREGLRDDHHIVFTHGDLGLCNILVDKCGDLIALIDWEMSGWMPEYWEYVKTVHGRWEDTEWLSYACIIAPPYDTEMEVDDRFIIVNGGASF